MMMDRDQVAALEQQQLLRGSIEGNNSGLNLAPTTTVSSLSPSSPHAATYSASLTPSHWDARGFEQRKYSSGIDARKYSSPLDSYKKYSSTSGYGGRGYLGYTPATGLGSSTNQQVPMIDDK